MTKRKSRHFRVLVSRDAKPETNFNTMSTMHIESWEYLIESRVQHILTSNAQAKGMRQQGCVGLPLKYGSICMGSHVILHLGHGKPIFETANLSVIKGAIVSRTCLWLRFFARRVRRTGCAGEHAYAIQWIVSDCFSLQWRGRCVRPSLHLRCEVVGCLNVPVDVCV